MYTYIVVQVVLQLQMQRAKVLVGGCKSETRKGGQNWPARCSCQSCYLGTYLFLVPPTALCADLPDKPLQLRRLWDRTYNLSPSRTVTNKATMARGLDIFNIALSPITPGIFGHFRARIYVTAISDPHACLIVRRTLRGVGNSLPCLPLIN